MTPKRIAKSITPPALWNLLMYVRRRTMRSVDCLTYAPRGWSTKLPNGADNEEAWGRFIAYAVADERKNCESEIRRIRVEQPLLLEPNNGAEDGEYLATMTCIYVLALAARLGPTPKILDYGGYLGDFCRVSKDLLPGLQLEYHCKELPAVAEEGRKLGPGVIWHTDDGCLADRYDVIIFSGCLQYIQEWQHLLRRAASAVGTYLFLSQVSTVERVSGYVAVQRMRGITLLHQQLKKADVLSTVQGTGLRLVREFTMREHPPIVNAPEQPSYRGWLFERDAGTA